MSDETLNVCDCFSLLRVQRFNFTRGLSILSQTLQSTAKQYLAISSVVQNVVPGGVTFPTPRSAKDASAVKECNWSCASHRFGLFSSPFLFNKLFLDGVGILDVGKPAPQAYITSRHQIWADMQAQVLNKMKLPRNCVPEQHTFSSTNVS